MDVNEKIVTEWLYLCKNQFTIANIPFKVFGPKGGSNYSNIDILATDKKGNFYDYEIKWRARSGIMSTDIQTFIKQMIRKERILKIKEIIGNVPYIKTFITTKLLFGRKEKEIVSKFNVSGIDVIFFEDIIQELVHRIDILGRYDSQVLQIIRMLKQLKIKLN